VKRVIFIISVIVLLLLINSLAHSIFDLLGKENVLTSAQKQLALEKAKNQKLRTELSYVQTDQFVEEEAHNKLFLVKPGEQEVLLPSQATQRGASASNQKLPNWQKWLNLFF